MGEMFSYNLMSADQDKKKKRYIIFKYCPFDIFSWFPSTYKSWKMSIFQEKIYLKDYIFLYIL